MNADDDPSMSILTRRLAQLVIEDLEIACAPDDREDWSRALAVDVCRLITSPVLDAETLRELGGYMQGILVRPTDTLKKELLKCALERIIRKLEN